MESAIFGVGGGREALARIARIFELDAGWRGKSPPDIKRLRDLQLRPHADAFFAVKGFRPAPGRRILWCCRFSAGGDALTSSRSRMPIKILFSRMLVAAVTIAAPPAPEGSRLRGGPQTRHPLIHDPSKDFELLPNAIHVDHRACRTPTTARLYSILHFNTPLFRPAA
jgi:hypothetical protein